MNPYETLQLAISLGMSTTAFLGEYVDRDTSFLKLRADGRCVFFDDTGSQTSLKFDWQVRVCVRADRPKQPKEKS